MPNPIGTSTALHRAKITVSHVGDAVKKLGTMGGAQRERLAEQIAREQQALFTSFLVQSRLGVSYEKMEFLLDILFVCMLAMKESGLEWPQVTDDDIQASMTRCVESVQFGAGVAPTQRFVLVSQFVVGHPEPVLLSYVQLAVANWLQRVTPEESDRYVALAALNMANCVGYANLAETGTLPPAALEEPIP